MKFVQAIRKRSYHSDDIVLVNLDKVEIIARNDGGYPVLVIGEESWTCPIQSLEDCIVEI